MPMVNQPMTVIWSGRVQQPGGEGDEHGVDGFGEEQLRDALDVADDAASLGHDVRQRGEAVVEEHDLGDGAGGG